ncbi:MAG: glycosyltransferase [Euryarchaeota archaeon]|jgi:glycosyltransferase involved in cell wall biosynthesis|nr:glycosyltransferase [Euryarchaeota archaeon]
MSDAQPLIASVIPVFNEASYIGECLDSLIAQTLPADQHIILVLDGGSEDSTRDEVSKAIERSKKVNGPVIELHSNPRKYVAEARNLALKLLPDSVQYTVEMIGHSTVEAKHLEIRMEEWKRIEASSNAPLAAVGIRVKPRTGEHGVIETWIERTLSSPFGSGNGQFENFTTPGPTNTPAFAMHSRSALEQIGGWDTSYITSQDSDLSMRLLEAGFALHRTPATGVHMVKRSGLMKWWKMGHRYGFWRMKVLQQHPKRVSFREFLPWFGMFATVAVCIFLPTFALLLPSCYLAVLLLEGVRSSLSTRRMSPLFGVPLCLLMLHISFSFGLLDGLIRKGQAPSDR